MKRPLFVFAGQSNMMGAAVREATKQIVYKNSFEYLHKSRRLGAPTGTFKQEGFPAGEFSYKDITAAYGENPDINAKSNLDSYAENTLFCPSMNNLQDDQTKTVLPFNNFSEATAPQMSPSLAPFIVNGLEQAGYCCAYTHIAKGGVSIKHYLEGQSKDYFYQKVANFFDDCQKRFADDDMSERVCIWLQGESDRNNGYDFYMDSLYRFWSDLQTAGITHMLVIRPPYWNDEGTDAMRAQARHGCLGGRGARGYGQNGARWDDPRQRRGQPFGARV